MLTLAHAKDLNEASAVGSVEEAADLQPRLHRRQFVIGPRPVRVNDAWQSIELSRSCHLSYCRTLPVEVVSDTNGQKWFLLGLAFQSDPDRPSPADEISSAASIDVPTLYGSWSGRWVLIGGDTLHMDACGFLGCFHHKEGDDGPLWVSSSAALLNDLVVHSPPSDVAAPIRHACGMDWYPPPRSRFRAISRLLPSQVLNLSSGGEAMFPRPLLTEALELRSYDDVLAFLERGLVTTLRNMARGEGALWVSLTAGRDTRLLLAAARCAGIDAKTYTYEKPLLSMRRGDRNLPPRLAAAAGYEHRLIPGHVLSRELAHMFDAHTARHCVDVDRSYFARRQWGVIPKPAFVLRGAAFGVGGVYFRQGHRFPLPDVSRDRARDIAEAWHFERWHKNSFAHHEGVSEWLEWIERAPLDLDWRDRFFIEQREAGWVSSIEQGLDLTGYEIAHPANCQNFFTAMMSIPEEYRLGKQHQADLVERMAPELARFPFNPPDPRILRRVRAERNLLRRRGPWKYVRTRTDRVRGAIGRFRA